MPRRHRRSLAMLGALALVISVGAPAVAGPRSKKPLVATGAVDTSPGLAAALASLPSLTPYGAFVHFRSGTAADHRALLDGYGMDVLADFETSARAVYALGTIGDIRGLTREPSIEYLEEDRLLEYHDGTAPWATRVRVAQEAVAGGPFFDAAGAIVDGTGVGVAVVDSGVDATHPDLVNRVGHNYKIVCATPGLINTTTELCFIHAFVDVGSDASTDVSSGHGSHVSGIVAGDGTASTGAYPGVAPNVRGSFTGVAPGATIHGYSVGEVISVLWVAEAYQHVFDNGDTFDPPVSVVNSSFGEIGGATYNPGSIESKIVNALVDKGVTMVFAAGNDGGQTNINGNELDGTFDATSSYCDNPTPGVICVANYDDLDTGARDGDLDFSSSRGLTSNPATWPDLSAPGSHIASTCRPIQPACAGAGIIFAGGPEPAWAPNYTNLGGTSMASPHVVGAVALLRQARPDLTPAEVEDVLLDTAFKFGAAYLDDPQNPGGTTSFDRGAGLLDVAEALRALGVDHAGDTTGSPDVRITSPSEGADVPPAETIVVSGTAHDGSQLPTDPQPELLVSGDGGDFSGPGAADIESLGVEESPTGLTYRVKVRDVMDFSTGSTGVTPNISLRVTQNIGGEAAFTNVTLTPTQVSPGTATPPEAVATSASRDVLSNTVSFFIPFSNLGEPGPGTPAHNVFASSFVGGIVDVAPSSEPPTTTGGDVIARPQFGLPYTITRPGLVLPPTVQVLVDVDGGAPTSASLVGTSPEYTWTTPVDPSVLEPGLHTITSSLLVNGQHSTQHAVTINVLPPSFTYELSILEPGDGTTVARVPSTISGSATTDDPSSDREVVVELTGAGYASGPMTVGGTDVWSLGFDFGALEAGSYTITAGFAVDGAVRAVDAVTVIVPLPAAQVSCSARNLAFWRAQFGQSATFTPSEAGALADHAVTLASGYFGDRDALLTALLRSGNLSDRQRAERQYAALLLNLAGGDLSSTLSRQAGLSRGEGLDPKFYDTGRLGGTVDTATSWIRGQLPNGNLGGVNEVASAINNGQKLTC